MKKSNIENNVSSGNFRVKDFFWLIIGIALVIFGGYLLVENAVKIGTHAGLDVWIIGITIVAAGTCSPDWLQHWFLLLRKNTIWQLGILLAVIYLICWELLG